MMSVLKLQEDHRKEAENRTMVELFHAYCSHEFGKDIWEEFMNIEEFNKMLTYYQPKFGDSIFSVLADTVSSVQGIPIMELLRNFSRFIRTYY
ncbi:MAG: hypothetical protein ACXAD7_19090 [Candidatus Kariarchaeaceae archaeon]|jgi:hypothetical protein